MTGTNSGLISRLAEHDIRKVAIIDDVYDALTREYITDKNELNDFWDAITENPAVLKSLEDKFPETKFESADDLSDEVLQKLWGERDEKSALGAFCIGQLIFQNRLQDIKRLDSICEHMQSLGLDPQKYGADKEIPKEPIKLVFIDYYLGSNDKAINIAREVYRRGEEGAEKPFIVLMSYKERSKTEIDIFCEESKLLRGLFDFVCKEDLSTKQKLLFKLETWLMGWNTRHVIQRFVDQVGNSLPDVKEKFEKKIRGLSFEDYAHIQCLSLEKEEYPLGQYVLWLYSSMFINLAFEENESINNIMKEINNLQYERFLPIQETSPLQLAEFYKVALSEPKNETVASEKELPPLRFGDLLILSKRLQVFMVANASCDLIRQRDPNYNIILIPGNFVLLSQSFPGEHAYCTELFEFQGQSYRIVWDHKQVVTRSHKKIKELLTKGVYNIHDRRLRSSYAIEIQQAFINNISRIGIPVQPPIYEYADVELWWVDKEGKCQQLSGSFKDGAVIFHLRNNNIDCALTVSFLLYFWAELNRISDRFDEEFSNINKINRETLRKYVDEYEKLLPIIQRWKLKDGKTIIDNFLTIYVDNSFKQPDKSKSPLCLNIRRADSGKDKGGNDANVEGENNAGGA